MQSDTAKNTLPPTVAVPIKPCFCSTLRPLTVVPSSLSQMPYSDSALSTVLGGYVADKFGNATAFIGLSCVAATGLLLILLVMPETRRTGLVATKEMAG